MKVRKLVAMIAVCGGLSMAAATSVEAATVPNNFTRTCSRVTGRCTPYTQTNPPYNPTVPSRYSTNLCWCWV